MTKAFRSSIALQTAFAISTLLNASAQTPAQTPSPASRMAVPQTSPADEHNFPPLLLQQLSAIKAAALNDDYAYHQVAHLTENIGPRPTGSLQAHAAAEYVAAELHKLGLAVRLQPVTVPHWIRGAETAVLTEYAEMVPGATQKITL